MLNKKEYKTKQKPLNVNDVLRTLIKMNLAAQVGQFVEEISRNKKKK